MKIKGWKPVIIIVILLAAGFAVLWKVKQNANPKETIKEVHPVYGNIQKYITATATVQPQNRLEMKSPIGGRIDKILVVEGQMVKTGDVLALMSSTERAALLDAARPQGAEAVKYWEGVYLATPIIAPIDGEVIVKSVNPGQTVTPTDDVVVLSDRLIVQAQVDETDVGRVKEGQKAVITLDAYPDIEVSATVEHIYYESVVTNNVTIYKVDIVPEKVPDVFRSGMSANAKIIEQDKEHVLLVPQEAVKRGKQDNFVFVKGEAGQKPTRSRVELGISDENNVEIVSGITENDTLIIKTQKAASSKGPKASGTNPFMPTGGGRR